MLNDVHPRKLSLSRGIPTSAPLLELTSVPPCGGSGRLVVPVVNRNVPAAILTPQQPDDRNSVKHPTRRKALLTGTMAVAGAAFVSQTGIATAKPERRDTGHATHADRPSVPKGNTMDEPEAFDEIYLGRHIQGWPAHDEHTGHPGNHRGNRSRRLSDEGSSLMEFVVRIDDEDLHVMQSVDGTWLSVVNHYQTQRTPQEVARAAVRDLNGASLVPLMV
ncbi:tyrosinase family oxidase copper chaperone [Streptomyces sp. 900105245]